MAFGGFMTRTRSNYLITIAMHMASISSIHTSICQRRTFDPLCASEMNAKMLVITAAGHVTVLSAAMSGAVYASQIVGINMAGDRKISRYSTFW